MSRRVNKNSAEGLKKRLEVLLKQPENLICADCSMKQPRWASSKLGMFMCIECSGIHRNLGTHISFVRSVNLDSWTVEQVEMMEAWGNARCKAYYEAEVPNTYQRPREGAGVREIQKWIRDKYEYKKFIPSDGSIPQKGGAPAEAPAPAPTPQPAPSPQKAAATTAPVSAKRAPPPAAAPVAAAPELDLLDFSGPSEPAPPQAPVQQGGFPQQAVDPFQQQWNQAPQQQAPPQQQQQAADPFQQQWNQAPQQQAPPQQQQQAVDPFQQQWNQAPQQQAPPQQQQQAVDPFQQQWNQAPQQQQSGFPGQGFQQQAPPKVDHSAVSNNIMSMFNQPQTNRMQGLPAPNMMHQQPMQQQWGQQPNFNGQQFQQPQQQMYMRQQQPMYNNQAPMFNQQQPMYNQQQQQQQQRPPQQQQQQYNQFPGGF